MNLPNKLLTDVIVLTLKDSSNQALVILVCFFGSNVLHEPFSRYSNASNGNTFSAITFSLTILDGDKFTWSNMDSEDSH